MFIWLIILKMCSRVKRLEARSRGGAAKRRPRKASFQKKERTQPILSPSDVEQGTGVDLRCGGGHLGLQGAPGALPRALGFDSRRDAKTETVLADGFCFWSRVRESNPPSQLGKLE